MTALAASDARASLADVLSERAKATPTSRLVIDAIGGALVAGVGLWARPVAWFPLVAASVCFFSYGVWAIAERRLESSAPISVQGEWMLRTLQRMVTPLGIAGFLGLLFGAVGVAFGTVIS